MFTMKSGKLSGILCNLSIVVLLSFLPNSIPVDGKANDFCTGQWFRLHRACYKFHNETATWDAAKQLCQQEGGYMASISSMAEKRKIVKHLRIAIKFQWMIGLKFNSNMSVWLWEDGGEFNDRITSWAPGLSYNRRSNKKCARMKSDGDLISMKCDEEYPFICEKNKITVPPTSSTSFVSSSTVAPQQTMRPQVDIQNITNPFKEKTPWPAMSTAITTEKRNISNQKTTIVITTAGRSTMNLPPKEESKSTTPSTIPDEGIYDVCYMGSRENSGFNKGKAHLNKDDKFCPQTRAFNINWPRIKAGTLAKMPCKKGPGFAYWQCGEEPTCWRKEPDVKECASAMFQELLEQTETMDEDEDSAPTEEVAVAVTSALVNITSGTTNLTTEDIIVTTEVINKIAKTKPKNKKMAEKIVKNAVQTGSNLLSQNQTKTWEDMDDNDRLVSASSIMKSMETVTMAMAEAIDEPAVIVIDAENIAMELRVLDLEKMETPDITYGDKDSEVVFSIPMTALKKYIKGSLVKVVFMTHYKIGTFLQQQPEEREDQRPSTKPVLGSKVFSASVSNGKIEMSEPVTFTMKLTKKMKDGLYPLCSFWEFSKWAAGHWSQQGCKVYSYNSTDVTCKCSHLTNFAVLMNVEPVKMAEIHVLSLRYITFVGCIISIICLFASWLTFQCFRTIHGERNSIHKHLACCLFVAEIVFLAGIDKTENEIGCAVVAGLLHYFFLAAFVWMFLEGVHIVMMLVKVFDASSSRLMYYYFIGYGIPLIIVGITSGIGYNGYGTSNFCWLSTEKFLIWSFAGPVAFILLVNAIILTYAMTTVCKHSEYVFQKEKGAGGNMKAWIQGALALEVLLGLTWVFGYFFISQETILMAYIFTIFNSLQGLFIFIFHCLLNKKIRKEYKKCLHIKEKSKTSTTTKSGSIRKPSTSYEMYNSSKA